MVGYSEENIYAMANIPISSPSEQAIAKLNQLTEDFPPTDVRITPLLDEEFPLEDIVIGTARMFEDVHKFRESNYTDMSLGLRLVKKGDILM